MKFFILVFGFYCFGCFGGCFDAFDDSVNDPVDSVDYFDQINNKTKSDKFSSYLLSNIFTNDVLGILNEYFDKQDLNALKIHQNMKNSKFIIKNVFFNVSDFYEYWTFAIKENNNNRINEMLIYEQKYQTFIN